MGFSWKVAAIVMMAGIVSPGGMGERAEPAHAVAPKVILEPGPEYRGGARRFQGIPSLERSAAGRLWVTWYGGKTSGEDRNNYVVLVTSGDDGRTWSEEVLAVDPDGDGPVRAFDPELWIDPDGRLWLFWAQSIDNKEPDSGVWAIVTDQPDEAKSRWSKPRRLTDGIMMCKPTVLSTGEWALPAARWRAKNGARMVVSTDHGKTWTERGACDVPKKVQSADEPMIVEKKDDTLWMWVRTGYGIGESVSRDRGRTWSALEPSQVPHPTARFFIRRLRSGNLLLVKHGPLDKRIGRSHLTAYLSRDDGTSWTGGLLLDERGGISYPDGVQAANGAIYITYDFDRGGAKKILMARFTEEDVERGAWVSKVAAQRILVHKAKGPGKKSGS